MPEYLSMWKWNLLSVLLLSNFVTSNLEALTFGVVPQQSPFKLMKVWLPVVKYLEKESGQKIVLKLEKSISSFEQKL